jgi:hypothetical protein
MPPPNRNVAHLKEPGGLKPSLSFRERPEPPKPPPSFGGGAAVPQGSPLSPTTQILNMESQRPSLSFRAKPEPPALPQTRQAMRPAVSFQKHGEAPTSPEHKNLDKKQLQKVHSLRHIMKSGGASLDQDPGTDSEEEEKNAHGEGEEGVGQMREAVPDSPKPKKRTTLVLNPPSAAPGAAAPASPAAMDHQHQPSPPPPGFDASPQQQHHQQQYQQPVYMQAQPPGKYAPGEPAPQHMVPAHMTAVPPNMARHLNQPTHSPVASPKSAMQPHPQQQRDLPESVRPILMLDPRTGYSAPKYERQAAHDTEARPGTGQPQHAFQREEIPAKASPWSPIWSDEQSMFYWYNSDTGESTWEDQSHLFSAKAKDEDKDVFGRSQRDAKEVRGSKALSSLLSRPLSMMSLGSSRNSVRNDGSGSSHGSSDAPIFASIGQRNTHVEVVAQVKTRAGTHIIVKPKGGKKTKHVHGEVVNRAPSPGPMVRALFDFAPSDPTNLAELPLRAGDELHLYEQGEDGWWGGAWLVLGLAKR